MRRNTRRRTRASTSTDGNCTLCLCGRYGDATEGFANNDNGNGNDDDDMGGYGKVGAGPDDGMDGYGKVGGTAAATGQDSDYGSAGLVVQTGVCGYTSAKGRACKNTVALAFEGTATTVPALFCKQHLCTAAGCQS